MIRTTAWLVFAFGLPVVGALAAGGLWWHIPVVMVSPVGALITIVLLNRGRHRDAGLVLTVTHWLSVAGSLALAGGLRSNATLSMCTVPLVGGLVGGQRTGALGGVLSVLTLAAFVGIEQYTGGIPTTLVLDETPYIRAVGPACVLLEVIGLTLASVWQLKQADKSTAGAIHSLHTARIEAERAGRAKQLLLANMSHEVRTPLNGVIGMTELLQRSELSASQADSLQVVHSSAVHLMDVLNDVLDLARLEAGEVELNRRPFEARRLVVDVLRTHEATAAANGTRLVAEVELGLAAVYLGDASRLRQIVNNLVSNAVKFTSGGVVTASVKAGPRELVIGVRDTGIGISADKLQDIFSDYGQASTSTQVVYGGTGLGLPISRRLAEAMGGALTVHSEEGNGATFTCRIPSEVLEPARPLPDLVGTRVGFVDSGSVVLASMLPHLEATGAELTRVGQVMGLDPAKLDVLVLDPAGNGMSDLVVAAQRSFPVQRMVLLAALGDELVLRQARALGVRHVLSLPADGTSLVEAVHEVVRPSAVRSQPARSEPVGVNPRRILLVEDNPVNQRVAELMLSQVGHAVEIVATGRDAVQRVRDGDYDLVLMDVQLPGWDGFQTTRAIRALSEVGRVPVVGLSAMTGSEVVERSRAAGMNALLSKPFTYDALLTAVEQWAGEQEVDAVELIAPVLDVDHLNFLATAARSSGRYEAISQLLDSFQSKSEQWIEAMRSLHDREPAAVGRLAHSFVGVAGAVGALRAAQCARELMLTAQDGVVDPAQVEALAAATSEAQRRLNAWAAQGASLR